MIDVRELRVGNLLNKEGVIVTIDARSIFDIWDKSDKYSPIPLTEEWFKKLGFNKDGFLLKKELWDRYHILIYDMSIRQFRICIKGPIEEFLYLGVFTSPKYVHTLQNLYFALTGEELTIK